MRMKMEWEEKQRTKKKVRTTLSEVCTNRVRIILGDWEKKGLLGDGGVEQPIGHQNRGKQKGHNVVERLVVVEPIHEAVNPT